MTGTAANVSDAAGKEIKNMNGIGAVYDADAAAGKKIKPNRQKFLSLHSIIKMK
jgi:hypothetical protein